MVQKVRGALEDAGGSWVVDGDFMSKIGGLVLDATTDIVWLDPPLLLYFPRLMLRTFRRLLGWEAQCRPGCDETLSTFFSGENILLYALTVHRRKRRTYQEIMDLLGVGVGTDVHGRRMRRIGGWGTELEEWLGEVEKLSKGD
ncbi:hypothetical protein CC2G_002110 [Coprinopsis cinerea AmutBmut pab1-1]|nr:hypothetical protein CC2G_002110 [Coprinopsis cinerea AmutBmut pab1-1]